MTMGADGHPTVTVDHSEDRPECDYCPAPAAVGVPYGPDSQPCDPEGEVTLCRWCATEVCTTVLRWLQRSR